jgi:hypothetical protein
VSESDPKGVGFEPPGPGAPDPGPKGHRVSRRTVLGWAALLVAFQAPLLYFLLRRWSRPTVRLTVKGPFRDLDPVALKAGAGKFVEPEQIQLYDTYPAGLMVVFSFAGAERKDRKIEVAVEAMRRDGQPVVRARRVCSDHRIIAREHDGERRGTLPSSGDVRNHEVFEMPEGSASDIERVDLTFREV